MGVVVVGYLPVVQFAPAQFALVQFALKEPIEYSKNGELNVTLEFGHVTLPEESTGIVGDLHMLGFNGTSPGPTLRVRAGDTLHILLKNTLPSELVSTSSWPGPDV